MNVVADSATQTGWRLAQWVALAVAVLLVGALLVRPEPALRIFWYLLIPIVPASLLLSPAIWRNVCPLATVNLLGSRLGPARRLDGALLRRAGVVGVALLALLVPARRLGLNDQPLVLAVTILLLFGVALLLGSRFDAKAGFCNSLCPVLPVERLYGQRPLLEVSSVRCPTCTLCTTRGCLDIAPEKSIPKTIGRALDSRAWLRRPYGLFAAGFPGFVVGYYTTADGPWSDAPSIYGWVALCTAISYGATVLGARFLSSGRLLVLLAAAAAGAYYWFVSPAIAEAFGWPGAAGAGLRVATLLLVVGWSANALSGELGRPGVGRA